MLRFRSFRRDAVMTLLACIARAVLKNGLKALLDVVPFGGELFDIASDAWKDYRGRQAASSNIPAEVAAVAEVQGLAHKTGAEAAKEAAQIVLAVAADQPAEVQLALELYLTQVPPLLRRSLRRPSDPTGTTVPHALSI